MGLFDKLFNSKKGKVKDEVKEASRGNTESGSKNGAKERNEIGNRNMKIALSNNALSLLKQGEDYNNLEYTQVEFGYLFQIEGHGLEALFKITTDMDVFYFAAQCEKLMRLTFNEELFQATTEGFLEIHG